MRNQHRRLMASGKLEWKRKLTARMPADGCTIARREVREIAASGNFLRTGRISNDQHR
jgi:hypothetical protein